MFGKIVRGGALHSAFLAVVFAFALAFAAALLAATPNAAHAENQASYDVSMGDVVIDDSCGDSCQGHEISGTTTQYIIKVTGGSHTIILNGVDITGSGSVRDRSPLHLTTIAGGNFMEGVGPITIVLKGENRLVATYEAPGVKVPENAKVTFTGEGKLYAQGAQHWPGIGRDGEGIIEIAGGTIEARGGQYASGIGGSNGQISPAITITGGNVTAFGGQNGAGIGGGDGYGLSGTIGGAGTIAITGGTVSATGGANAAGIGSGDAGGAGGSISISGGVVTAVGGSNAAGIGGGSNSGNINSVSVSGGLVFATAGSVGGKAIDAGSSNSTDPDVEGAFISVDNSASFIAQGDIVVSADYVIDGEKNLFVPNGRSLTLANGVTLTLGDGSSLAINEGGALVMGLGARIDLVGNASMSASGTLQFAVVTSFENISAETPAHVSNAEDYVVQLTAAEGFGLPDAVTVTAGDKTLVAGRDYTWDKESGNLAIWASSVSGELHISAVGVENTPANDPSQPDEGDGERPGGGDDDAPLDGDDDGNDDTQPDSGEQSEQSKAPQDSVLAATGDSACFAAFAALAAFALMALVLSRRLVR